MRKSRGFANPEYLLTLTAVVLLLALIVPRLVAARKKRDNLRGLAELRSALARYAADTKTKGPQTLSELTKGGKYLAAIPAVEIMGHHARSSEVKEVGVTDDAGGWSYANWPGGAREGEVWINCTHTDTSGKAWADY